MTPYRTSTQQAHEEAASVDDPCPNGDLVIVTLVFWGASIARVAAAVARHETFGAETTFATFAVGLSSIVLRDAGVWLFRRVGSRLGRARSSRPR